MRLRNKKAQAIVEYLLLVLMVSVTIAITIRNTNRTIYLIWTGIARQIALPCANCDSKPAPDF